MLLVKEGNTTAFTQLFDDHKNAVYTLAIYLTSSEAIAEDIVQEVLAGLGKNGPCWGR